MDAIHAHYAAQSVATFDLEPLGVEAWRSKLDDAVTAGHPWLVLDEDGEVAGYAISGTFRPKAAYRTTVETTVYLHPGAVGRGAALRLYEALLAEAAERDFHRAVAGVTLPNEASVRLHEALGFKAVGVFTEVGHKFGEWHDVA